MHVGDDEAEQLPYVHLTALPETTPACQIHCRYLIHYRTDPLPNQIHCQYLVLTQFPTWHVSERVALHVHRTDRS